MREGCACAPCGDNVKERPILFSGPMVKAILDGRKTQTRRVVQSPRKSYAANHLITVAGDGIPRIPFYDAGTNPTTHDWMVIKCPYGAVGSKLWVRETFCVGYENAEGQYTAIPFSGFEEFKRAFYRADGGDPPDEPQRHWKPSIFMPRWASRITLEITEVRVQKLADISQSDCQAEGCSGGPERDPTPRTQFMALWDSINGKKYPWASNPFCWAITFKVIK